MRKKGKRADSTLEFRNIYFLSYDPNQLRISHNVKIKTDTPSTPTNQEFRGISLPISVMLSKNEDEEFASY